MALLSISELTSASIGEYQRNYLFKIEVLSYPALLTIPSGFNVDTLDLFMDSTTIPEAKAKVITLPWAGEKANWAGPLDHSGTIDLKGRTNEKMWTYDFFKNWANLRGAVESGAQHAKPLYIGQIKLSLVGVDKTTVTRSWVLKNVFPVEVKSLTVDKTKAEFLDLSITLSYDYYTD